MENQNTELTTGSRQVKTPTKVLARMQLVNFGKILNNLQYVVLFVMLASVLSFLVPAIYYIILLFVTLITLFSVFAWYPEFTSWWAGGEVLSDIANTLAQSWKYTVPLSLALAISSIVLLCLDKNEKHVPRIVISVIVAVLAIVVLALKLINGGAV